MADDPGEGIYRAMREGADGMPVLGTSAETLGIRKDKDIIPDPSGMVHRSTFIPDEANGLSCAPAIHDLPRFALPRIWGGRNKRTVIWQIDAADLGPDLIAGIEVAMSFKQEFLTALQSGQDHRALLKIVRRHFGDDTSEKAAYEALEQLWRDLGFDESDQESTLRNELEYVMERVWYFGRGIG